MFSSSFNNSFLKQFRQQSVFYTGAHEIPFENLLFKTFGSNNTDLQILGKALNEQLTDTSFVRRLLVKLTNTDSSATERLSAFVQDITNELITLAEAEPYTAQFYNLLIEVLGAFNDLLNEFQVNGKMMLCDKLTEYFTLEMGATANPVVYSEEVRNMHGTIQDYLYQVGEFYEYFHMLLQKESEGNENQKGVLVISQVSCYLETLIDCTEKLLINTESTLDILCTWETAVLNREAQELFN